MKSFDTGLLLLSSDFRKTFVSKQQNINGETEQIRKGLLNLHYTCLNPEDKLLLANDLAFIFSTIFYDFDHGCLYADKTKFFRSDETLLFFSDYLLYFSFISSFYKPPSNSKSILNDISSPTSRKIFFTDLREPLSPYLFITFINNLIDSTNLISPNSDPLTIENEMCRQIMLNAKEFSVLSKFIELHKSLLEKVKAHLKKSKITVTKEMENDFTFYFAHSFYQTIVYPSDQFKDRNFGDMTKNLFKIQHTSSTEMDPLIHQFDYDKDLLSYHTYIYQRALCIEQKDAWIHPPGDRDIFLFPAQLRLTLISKKVGELMGENRQPIGNTVVIIIVPVDQIDSQKLVVEFVYNEKTYRKRIVDGVVDSVFPCFKDLALEIRFVYKNKTIKQSIQINSLQDPPENEIMQEIKFEKKTCPIIVNTKFYSHDKPLDNLIAHVSTNPTKLFDFLVEAFIHKYLSMNAQFIYAYRGEDDDVDDDNGQESTGNLFSKTSMKNLRIKQDIGGRAFPIDFWLFLVDFAIKYSIPSSYFFARITDKLNKCWCTAQAFIDFYCIILYNLYHAINNSEHHKDDEELFNNSIRMIKEKCVRLLLNQLAKPENYQRHSITSLILLLSLANDGDVKDLADLLKSIFLSSLNNINSSIYNLIVYVKSDKECNSMDLFNSLTNKPDFEKGPHNLPLCMVDLESLKKALDLVIYRSRSISSFYLESFLPSFTNLTDSIIFDMKTIAINIAQAFDTIDPNPDQKDLVHFVAVYQQLFQLFRKDEELNPAVLFNDSIEQWMFDLSGSMIELIERSIKFDDFSKRSEKTRTSDSFYEIFLFFKQGFDFLTSLNFEKHEIKDKLMYFLTTNSAICLTYVEYLLSMASKQFRGSFNQPVQTGGKAFHKPVKQKQIFPSWCPDITEARVLPFEKICVMVNDVASIRLKWFQYIVEYDKYLPNQPQIAVALKATDNKKSISILNDNNNDDEDVDESKSTFKDPCYKLTTKINFMLNFLRLDLTYAIIGLLNRKMWTFSTLDKLHIKQLRENFFTEKGDDDENITTVFEKIFAEFKDRIEKVKNFLQISLHLRCVPQLVRAVEDGIFECMIPMAFSTKSKNVFNVLSSAIENLFTEMFNHIEEAGFTKEIVNRSVTALRFMPYIRNYIHLSLKEVEDELKIEKSKAEGDFNYKIILLSIVVQVVSPVPLPKTVNPNYTLISLE